MSIYGSNATTTFTKEKVKRFLVLKTIELDTRLSCHIPFKHCPTSLLKNCILFLWFLHVSPGFMIILAMEFAHNRRVHAAT